jgi:hypothetical protein
MTHAAAVAPGEALVADSTRLEDLDSDAITGLHTPTLRGAIADGLDDANRLVARDEREAGR